MMHKVAAGMMVVMWALCAGTTWGAAPASEPAPGEVEKAAEQRIGSVRDAIVDALWLKTDEYWHGGNPAPVIGICRTIIQLDPQFVEAYSVGAWVASQQGDNKAAIAFYQQGIAANPDRYELQHELGMYYMYHDHDLKAALPHLKRAAELDSPGPVKRTYAHALTKAGMFKQAAAEWRRILKLDPNDQFAQRELKKLRDEGKIGPGD